MNARRVLHITPNYWPVIGGLETFVHDLATRQRAAGVDAQVLCLNRPSRRDPKQPAVDEHEGVPVRRIGFVDLKFYKPTILPAWFLRSFDLLHVHTLGALLDATVLLKPVHRRPIIVSSHGGIFHTDSLRLVKSAYVNGPLRLTLAACRAAVASGPNDERLLRRLSRRAIRIPNGINLTDVLAIDRVSVDPFSLVFVGRLARNKRVELLITTLAELKKLDGRYTLDVVGPDFESLLPALRDRASSLGVESSVRFHGAVSRERLVELLARAGVCVSASRYEGFGLAAVESIAAGCLPVLQRIEAFADLAAPDCLTDFEKPIEAARAIAAVSMIDDSERRLRSDTCRAGVTRFDWTAIFPRWQTLYDNVLRGLETK